MEELKNYAWKVESLRLTSFLKHDFNGNLLESWLKEISRNEPLSINKSINYFQGLAPINSTMLKLERNNNRIDLILDSNAPPFERNIGSLSEIGSLMNDILFGFIDLDNWPASKRLAIGVILNISIKDYDEGVDVLQPKLKSVTVGKGTTDFLFRINNPIQSKTVTTLKLNRLMTWSITQRQFIKIPLNIGPAELLHQNIQQGFIPESICRLEMDFNTIENEEIEMLADKQKEVSNELLTEAMKVAEKGEFGIEL